MANPLPLEFVMSAPRHDALPFMRAEVAVLGRSNVGKSSLINALAARKGLAIVSQTPGRTRLLNCFSMGSETALIDCPGYGYAAASRNARDDWMAMVEDYLIEREPLKMLLLLVDGLVGPTAMDRQVLDEMRDSGVPVTVVATKMDKVKPSTRQTRRRQIAEGCEVDAGEVFWVSATKGTGIGELRAFVRSLLGR